MKSLPNPFVPMGLFSPSWCDALESAIRSSPASDDGERPSGSGLSRVPVAIKSVSDESLLEVSLIENIQRENLNPIEEANAYLRLSQEFGLTQEEVAQRTGKDRSTVTNFLRLLKLPGEVQQMVLEGLLSMGHARAILAMEGDKEQRALAERAIENGWSVRQVERVIAANKAPILSQEKKQVDPNVRAATEAMERSLGTRVRIVEKGKKGRIEIDYYSQEELQRLYERLANQETPARD